MGSYFIGTSPSDRSSQSGLNQTHHIGGFHQPSRCYTPINMLYIDQHDILTCSVQWYCTEWPRSSSSWLLLFFVYPYSKPLAIRALGACLLLSCVSTELHTIAPLSTSSSCIWLLSLFWVHVKRNRWEKRCSHAQCWISSPLSSPSHREGRGQIKIKHFYKNVFSFSITLKCD